MATLAAAQQYRGSQESVTVECTSIDVRASGCLKAQRGDSGEEGLLVGRDEERNQGYVAAQRLKTRRCPEP